MNLGAAVLHETAPVVVVAPVTTGDTTTVTVDATQTGVATFVLPYADPAGEIITGAPWTSPRFFIGEVTPPTANEGVSWRIGMGDAVGPAPAPATDPLVAAGATYDNATGPRAQILTDSAGPNTSAAAVAGGLYIDFELTTRSSPTTANATFVQSGSVVILVNKVGGPPAAATLIAPNAHYAGVPYLIFQIEVTGASANAAMPLAFRANYTPTFKQTELGGP